MTINKLWRFWHFSASIRNASQHPVGFGLRLFVWSPAGGFTHKGDIYTGYLFTLDVMIYRLDIQTGPAVMKIIKKNANGVGWHGDMPSIRQK